MTTPQPQGLPPLREIEPAFDHPEHHMKWTRSEIKWIKEYATDYAREALRAMPASRKDIEQAAFEKWLDKERPSGDVEQVQRQWEESSDYEEVQPAALLAEINHWHAIAKKLESELTALRAQAASVEPYGQITTHTETGQQFFYRWPQSPYLDNASECVTVYAGAPPAQAASVKPVASVLYLSDTGLCSEISEELPWGMDLYASAPPPTLCSGASEDTERLQYVYTCGNSTSSDSLVDIELRLLNGDQPSLNEVRLAIDAARATKEPK